MTSSGEDCWDDLTPVVTAHTPDGPLDEFEVVITYREPTYALRAGTGDKLYRGAFRVRAPSEERAVVAATESFHQAAQQSGVAWPRLIHSVRVSKCTPSQ